MTGDPSVDRDRAAVEALMADHYLDALLAAADRRADDAPADASLDPELRQAARALRRVLVRVHPSFRFEERLAARLSMLAAAQARSSSAAGDTVLVPFATPPGPTVDALDPLLGAILAGDLDPAADAVDEPAWPVPGRRPLLVGGAITSAAISLVGVAWVAWRTTRPGARTPASAMVRAVRAAHGRRPVADALAAAVGYGGRG